MFTVCVQVPEEARGVRSGTAVRGCCGGQELALCPIKEQPSLQPSVSFGGCLLV